MKNRSDGVGPTFSFNRPAHETREERRMSKNGIFGFKHHTIRIFLGRWKMLLPSRKPNSRKGEGNTGVWRLEKREKVGQRERGKRKRDKKGGGAGWGSRRDEGKREKIECKKMRNSFSQNASAILFSFFLSFAFSLPQPRSFQYGSLLLARETKHLNIERITNWFFSRIIYRDFWTLFLPQPILRIK